MIELKRDSTESQMLSWLRFPLAALIVFIHTGYPSDDPSQPAFYIGKLLSDGIASIAVPTFFFISGYLFFIRYKQFGFHEYADVLRKKFFSLVIPYVLWIAFVYYGYGFYSGQISHISFNPSDLYRVFWAESDGYIATSIFGYKFSILSAPSGIGVLWFVRDLIVAMVLSPVIWSVVKICRMWSVLIFLLPYIFFIAIPIKGFGLAALCFFPIGATFSICSKNILEFVLKWGKWSLIAFCILLLAKYMLDIQQMHSHRILGQLVILAGIGAVLYISYKSLKHTKSSKWICILGESSFFIYVGHALPIFFLLSPLTRELSNSRLGGIIAYFLSWGIRIIIVVATFFLMKKICPRILSVLVGGRISNVNK